MQRPLLSGFVDEVLLPWQGQVGFAKEMGLGALEARFLKLTGDGPKLNASVDLTPGQAAELWRVAQDNHVVINGLGSPIGKKWKTIKHAGFSGPVPFDEVIEEAKRIREVALALHVRAVRIFGGNRDGAHIRFADIRSQVIEQVGKLTEVFAHGGLIVLLENEGFTATATPEETAAVVWAVRSPYLWAVYDEGNHVAVGNVGDYAALKAGYDTVAEAAGAWHLKRCAEISEANPALSPGVWTPEDTLTQFLAPGGPVFQHMFQNAGVSLENFGEHAPDKETPFVFALEPHRGKSERFFGETPADLFVDSAWETLRLARRYGITLDVDEVTLEAMHRGLKRVAAV